MNQIQVDISKAPCFVLRLCHLDGMLLAVVVVPQLGGDKDVLALDKAFFDGSLYTLAGFLLVLVVICAIEQTIADFNGLVCVSVEAQLRAGFEGGGHIVDGVGRCLSRHFPKTETDEGHRLARGQLDCAR